MNVRPSTIALALLRIAPVVFPLSLVPEFAGVLLGRLDAVLTLHEAAVDALGTGALFALAASFSVTPIRTLTGWHWHLPLARDFGLWTFGLAATDLLIAAVAAEGGWLSGIAGKAFLAAGTLAVLLLVPMVVTSNRASMLALRRDWKRLHRLVYVVIALVGLHLLLLERPRALIAFVLLFGPPMLLRIGPVRRWVVHTRRRLTRRKPVA